MYVCQGRLIRFLDDDNAAELMSLAFMLNANLLISASKAVIFRHFSKVRGGYDVTQTSIAFVVVLRFSAHCVPWYRFRKPQSSRLSRMMFGEGYVLLSFTH